MAVLRPDPPTIRASIGAVIGASRALARNIPDGAITWLGALGLAAALEIWARTQPEAATDLGLRWGYAHLALGMLFATLVVRSLTDARVLPRSLRRRLTILSALLCAACAAYTLPGLEIAKIDLPAEASLAIGLIVLFGLLPTATAAHVRQSAPRRIAQNLAVLVALFTTMLALILLGNVSGLSGAGLVCASLISFSQLVWPSGNAARQRRKNLSGWVGNAIYANREENPKSTRTQTDHPTEAEATRPEASTVESQPEPQVVKRMRFQAPNFTPIIDYELDPDDGPPSKETEETQRAYQRPQGTLEASIISSLELLDRLEQYAGDADKLSVLYRRSEGERVLRCSLAVNFDPLEDGWTALEVANKILEIVREFTPRGLKLIRLEIRIYQERFRQGEQRRFERTFNFDLTNLEPPPLESPDQL